MKKSLTPLGETEMEILHIVWKKEKTTVAEVLDEILKKRKTAYTTVMTIMKNLYNKGYLNYEKVGMTYVYSAAKQPDDVQTSLVERIVSKVFEGSPVQMVQTLVKNGSLSNEEISEIKKIVDNIE